ncbi:DUF397 domain-containing protein [Streptomyces sp. NPDC041068]|uniref:DUF397 domain-containing protein n=1 Tax=Streptomyces sp. NPDC041068 TaxID=3155130 RepID=UPI0033E45F28
MVDGGPSAQQWRTSSRSENGNECVAVRFAGEGVMVRDSKDPDAARLAFSRGAWRGLLTALKSGSFHGA